MPAQLEFTENAAIKYFDDAGAFQRELTVYQAALPSIPMLLDFGKAETYPHFIKAQRLFGIPYLDAPDFSSQYLATAISGFHQATLAEDGRCLCHIDNQPKNILLCSGDFFFIDFEDARVDYPETDISHLLLFWAAQMEHPEFIEKTSAFLEQYQRVILLRAELWDTALAESISRFDTRRQEHGKGSGCNELQDVNRQWLKSVLG